MKDSASDVPASGWARRPVVDPQLLDNDRWLKGYFNLPAGWTRDFGEILRRECALAALGPVHGKSVLDVACGAGLFMVPLAMLGARVAGQDLSEQYVSEARACLARHHVDGDVRVGNATQLQFDSGAFDAVISGDFVEHISSDVKNAFFSEVFRVLKPGGVLVVKTPNLSYLRAVTWARRALAPWQGRSPFRIHIAHTRNNPDNEHHGLMTFSELRGFLDRAGFLPAHFVRQPLVKPGLSAVLQRTLPELPLLSRFFNADIIAVCRKPVFIGLFP